jgi:hypothetical protein
MNKKHIIHKGLTVTVLFLAILYLKCGDNAVSTNSVFRGLPGISGKISNWTYGGNFILKAEMFSKLDNFFILSSCPIDSLGNFSLSFPASISDTTIFGGDSLFYETWPGIISVNPIDAKGNEIHNLQVFFDSSYFGSIKKGDYYSAPEAGSFDESFLFVNKDVNVTGYKCIASDTLKFNFSAVAGWNMIDRHFERVSAEGNTVLYNNTEPSGGVWKFFP